MLRKFRVKINGKEYLVEMEELGAPVSQGVNSQPVIQQAPTPQVAATPVKSQPQSGGHEVVAPMPGTILDIKVQVGQQVEVDQTLVILEAMKMENEIVAPQAGVITEILVSKNEAIDVGRVIVRIK